MYFVLSSGMFLDIIELKVGVACFTSFGCLQRKLIVMVSGIETIGASSGVVIPQIQAAPVAPGSSPSFASAVASVSPASSSVASMVANVSHGPHVIQDPAAGFITQYLSANGSQVVSQTPSVITVAYLRLGLTAEGVAKEASYAPVGTIA
jgi:hypothetical protein